MTKRGHLYTRAEELWNSWSHAAGIVLAVVVGTLFIVWAARHANGWATFGVSLYLFGMLGSYVASTIYHALSPANPWKERLGPCRYLLAHCRFLLAHHTCGHA